MAKAEGMLEALGGEAGCRRLSREFYGRVAAEPVLRPLFPGKTLKCTIDEFAAFLIQFLGGDEEQTQKRWWLSLQESHARFRIGAAERAAWLRHMAATLEAADLDEAARNALGEFFGYSASYVIGKESAAPRDGELAARWSEQRALDDTVAAIEAGAYEQAAAMAERFAARRSVFVGLLARMVKTRRPGLVRFAVKAVERDPELARRRFGGRTLLHYAAGAGCVDVVDTLLRLGMDPDVEDDGGHTALYRVANECGGEAGPRIVRALVEAGADVNAAGGVTHATPLHMAARRGFVEVARALLAAGAAVNARDKKGDTPLARAANCRKDAVAELLRRSEGSGR